MLICLKRPLIASLEGIFSGGRHQPHACCTAGEELPCHPHVKDKSSSVVKMNEKVFSAPLEIGNGSPQEAQPEAAWGGYEEIAVLGRMYRHKSPPDQNRADT